MPDAVVVFLDLETSGRSILTDNIVEIGVVGEYGATFSTVVCPFISSPNMRTASVMQQHVSNKMRKSLLDKQKV